MSKYDSGRTHKHLTKQNDFPDYYTLDSSGNDTVKFTGSVHFRLSEYARESKGDMLCDHSLLDSELGMYPFCLEPPLTDVQKQGFGKYQFFLVGGVQL